MAERTFSTEVIVSCLAFYKIDNNLPISMNDAHLANLIGFMAGMPPLVYLKDRMELITGASICGLLLIEQYPALDVIEYPYVEYQIDPDHFTPWIANIYSSFGSEMTVQSAENWVPAEAEHARLVEINRTLQTRFNL